MLVIFDLDGVLFESRDKHFTTLNTALAEFGQPVITPEEHESTYNGRPTAEKLKILDVPVELHASIKIRKQQLTVEWISKLMPDARLRRLLLDLRLHNVKIGVCSNAVRLTVDTALLRLGLAHLVDLAFSAQEVEHPKPHPEMYWRAILSVGEWPEHTVIVEDSPLGVQAARATGAHVLVVKGPEEVTYDRIIGAFQGRDLTRP